MARQARRFHPDHILSSSEWERALTLLGQVRALQDPYLKRFDEFKEFCHHNGLTPVSENLIPYAVAMEAAGLRPRTIRNYVWKVRHMVTHGAPPKGIFYRLLSALCAGADRRHAVDADDQTVGFLLDELKGVHHLPYFAAVFMAVTGFRFRDLTHLRFDHIRWDSRGLCIDVRFSKNIRSEIHRKELVIPSSLMPKGPLETHVLTLRNWLSCAQPIPTFLPTHVELGDFNRLLRGAVPTDQRAITSYTLRRFAFHRFIAACRGKEGLVDWAQVARFTLHNNPAVAQAFYYKGVH